MWIPVIVSEHVIYCKRDRSNLLRAAAFAQLVVTYAFVYGTAAAMSTVACAIVSSVWGIVAFFTYITLTIIVVDRAYFMFTIRRSLVEVASISAMCTFMAYNETIALNATRLSDARGLGSAICAFIVYYYALRYDALIVDGIIFLVRFVIQPYWLIRCIVYPSSSRRTCVSGSRLVATSDFVYVRACETEIAKLSVISRDIVAVIIAYLPTSLLELGDWPAVLPGPSITPDVLSAVHGCRDISHTNLAYNVSRWAVEGELLRRASAHNVNRVMWASGGGCHKGGVAESIMFRIHWWLRSITLIPHPTKRPTAILFWTADGRRMYGVISSPRYTTVPGNETISTHDNKHNPENMPNAVDVVDAPLSASAAFWWHDGVMKWRALENPVDLWPDALPGTFLWTPDFRVTQEVGSMMFVYHHDMPQREPSVTFFRPQLHIVDTMAAYVWH